MPAAHPRDEDPALPGGTPGAEPSLQGLERTVLGPGRNGMWPRPLPCALTPLPGHRGRGPSHGAGATLTLTHGLAHTVGGSSLSTASRATIQPLGDAETTTAQVQSAPARGTARASGTVEATCGVGDQEPGSGRSEPRCASVRSRCWGSIPFACSCGPFFPTPQQLGPDRVSLGEGLTSGHHLRLCSNVRRTLGLLSEVRGRPPGETGGRTPSARPEVLQNHPEGTALRSAPNKHVPAFTTGALRNSSMEFKEELAVWRFPL
ncbi:uncharacterized protein LOC133049679 [Dama dama]|uniref:uncharacterized protein LOC133049679 n=1 Tax=Dama dama TaxID=30532 RepID=UPI002A36AFF7|nr:uncharacterized protein LOC133049679 [Dama dama]